MEKIDKRNIKQFNGERYSIWNFRVKSQLRYCNPRSAGRTLIKGGLITALETLNEDNLNLTFVKNRLLDYEVKIKGDSDNATGTKILSVSVPGSSGSNQNFSFHKKNAKNAGRFKYKPQKGFKKNSHQNKFKSGRQYKCSNLKCDHCGRTNHMKKDFYFYTVLIKYFYDWQHGVPVRNK
jgi:hypothetical protein